MSEFDYVKRSIEWAKNYANDMAGIEDLAYKSEPYRICIYDMYKYFVNKSELAPIEKLEQEHKQSLFDESKRLFPETKNNFHRIQLCVFLYFMNFIFEKYFIVV